jgi:hypothetical protein
MPQALSINTKPPPSMHTSRVHKSSHKASTPSTMVPLSAWGPFKVQHLLQRCDIYTSLLQVHMSCVKFPVASQVSPACFRLYLRLEGVDEATFKHINCKFSRMCLVCVILCSWYGNTSSSSTYYALAYVESINGVKKGETLMQVIVGNKSSLFVKKACVPVHRTELTLMRVL